MSASALQICLVDASLMEPLTRFFAEIRAHGDDQFFHRNGCLQPAARGAEAMASDDGPRPDHLRWFSGLAERPG